MKYDVHLFDVVRVKYPGIEAGSQKEAIQQALSKHYPNDIHDRNRPWQNVECVEYADEIAYAVVDEDGDTEYERSRWYDKCELGMLP